MSYSLGPREERTSLVKVGGFNEQKYRYCRLLFRTRKLCYSKDDRAMRYNITSPQGPRVHLPVTYFLFRDTTFHLVLALSASLRPKYGTPYLFTSANLKLTLTSDVILRRTTLFQPMSPPSGPCNAP